MPGAAAAAKKWRGLINIHDLDCTMLHARIFERVADAVGTLTAAAPSICMHMHPYRAARMLNQLKHGIGSGHVLTKKWGSHGRSCRPYAAAPVCIQKLASYIAVD